jgi:hypothetical protein
LNQYDDVITRFLLNSERNIPSEEKQLPLVLTAKKKRGAEYLQAFLAAHSPLILQDLNRYRAILLRGFDIDTPAKFQNTMLSIQGIEAIANIFMSEAGREHVDNLDYVFYTNKYIKTGGGLNLSFCHNENYFQTDIPMYMAFCCFTAPKFGGETGLIAMQQVYEGLDDSIQHELEKRTFFVTKDPLSLIAKRYQLSEEKLRLFCFEHGLEIEDNDIVLYKPSVLLDPRTKNKYLFGNVYQVPHTVKYLIQYFHKDYQEWFWLLHRFLWKNDGVVFLMTVWQIFRMPFSTMQWKKKIICQMYRKKKNRIPEGAPEMTHFFNDEHRLDQLTQLVRKHHASFIWKPGDILLLDNTQVAHMGMPGLGKRELRTMLLNNIKLNYSSRAPGLQSIGAHVESLGDRLMRLRD